MLGAAPTAVGRVGGRGAAVAVGAASLSKEEGMRAALPVCRWPLRSPLLVERWIGVRHGGRGWERTTTMLLSSSDELSELSLLSSSSLLVRASVPMVYEWRGAGIFILVYKTEWNMGEGACSIRGE